MNKFLCVVCDGMECVLFAVLCVNLYVLFSLCCVWPYGMSTVRSFECDITLCVILAVLFVTIWYV